MDSDSIFMQENFINNRNNNGPKETLDNNVDPLELPGSRRSSSLTPESPYQVSDETRARGDLLQSDDQEVQSDSHDFTNLSEPHQHCVADMLGKASEFMEEVAEILAGVSPVSRGKSNLNHSDAKLFAEPSERFQRNLSTAMQWEEQGSNQSAESSDSSKRSTSEDPLLKLDAKSDPQSQEREYSCMSDVVCKASELIEEAKEFISAVLPTKNALHPGKVEFFIDTPDQSRRESFRQTNSEERNNSFTPESPYQVSDETRSRPDNLDCEKTKNTNFD